MCDPCERLEHYLTVTFMTTSSGPLIPRMQEYFNIGYTIVSLIFVSICVGESGSVIHRHLTT